MIALPNDPWPRSCLQVYTGEGKGKTTAALGLSLRAAGRGMKVFIGQFMKGSTYGELEGVKMLGGNVKIEQFGSRSCIPYRDTPSDEDIALASSGLARSREVLLGGEYDIVVLDEICVAVYFGLIKEDALMSIVAARPKSVELICTGRYATSALIDQADLVTEMNATKHPYETSKLSARDGIER